MALKRTASGKVDKRTTQYKEMVERARKARAAKGENSGGWIALLITGLMSAAAYYFFFYNK
ncbi:MAG: hypothetical protein D8H93_31550 [Capnocytophaga sp.]|nr:MAG: hypothetical protein D8H93_31550 [Capnocytophaga sp.]